MTKKQEEQKEQEVKEEYEVNEGGKIKKEEVQYEWTQQVMKDYKEN